MTQEINEKYNKPKESKKKKIKKAESNKIKNKYTIWQKDTNVTKQEIKLPFFTDDRIVYKQNLQGSTKTVTN